MSLQTESSTIHDGSTEISFGSKMSNIRIRGIGKAVPEHIYDQQRIRELVKMIFQEGIENLDRLLRVFEAFLQISQRHFVREAEWYLRDHSFAETNEVYA